MKSFLNLIRLELITDRRRSVGLLSLLVYGLSLLFLVAFFARLADNARSIMIIFWLVLMFSALFVNRKAFHDAENKGFATVFFYFHPLEYYLSRWVYYLIMNTTLSFIYLLFFRMWFHMPFFSTPLSWFYLFSGIFGIHSVSVMGAAFSFRSGKAGLLSNLASIPLMIPVLLVIAKIGILFVEGTAPSFAGTYLRILWLVSGISFLSSLILFPYLWKP